MARRIRVVNIDDRNQLDKDRYAPFVDLLPIESELGAQELLAEIVAPTSPPIDIFLVDIDMSANWQYHVKGLYWGPDAEGTATSLRPYGPMLAVPFLMSGAEMIFVPYSNWWGSPAVYENGFVLLSCAFIFSRVYGGVWTLEDTQDYIRNQVAEATANVSDQTPDGEAGPDAYAGTKTVSADEGPGEPDERSLLQDPEKALRTGLCRLRKQLGDSGSIQFVNVEATCRKMEALDDASLDHGVPLCDPDTGDPISIEWVSARRSESVEISSLYGDVLDFRTQVDHKTICGIAKILQREILPRSIENIGTIYDMAKQALRECTIEGQPSRRLDKVLETMKKSADTRLSADQWQLLKRLAVLFAWVRTWREENDAEKRITRVRSFLGFPTGQKGATNSYSRLIRGGDGSTAGKGRWHQPFRKNHKNGQAAEDFKLDLNQAEALTPVECRLCTRYADEVLQWIEDLSATSKKYPQWMTTPNDQTLLPS